MSADPDDDTPQIWHAIPVISTNELDMTLAALLRARNDAKPEECLRVESRGLFGLVEIRFFDSNLAALFRDIVDIKKLGWMIWPAK
jgi:hypothetical protein